MTGQHPVARIDLRTAFVLTLALDQTASIETVGDALDLLRQADKEEHGDAIEGAIP